MLKPGDAIWLERQADDVARGYYLIVAVCPMGLSSFVGREGAIIDVTQVVLVGNNRLHKVRYDWLSWAGARALDSFV